MPILTVKISGLPSPDTSRAVSSALAEMTHRILHKPPELIAIAIDYTAPADWFVGGQSLAELGENAFDLDIKISDETNTKTEKAQFITEVFEFFSRQLGRLNPKSYIHVEDVRAAAYGYGGRTQEYRFHHQTA